MNEEKVTSIDIIRDLEYNNLVLYRYRQWDIPSANEEVYGNPAG